MAEHERVHDGRFGERFDEEISVKGLAQIALGIAVTCILAILITLPMIKIGGDPAEEVPQEATLPVGPLLQAAPEAEYEQMRHELDAQLDGYGWVDEAAGTVYVPIDEAIDRVLERGLEASITAAEAMPVEEGGS